MTFHLDGRLDDSLAVRNPEVSFLTADGALQKLSFVIVPRDQEMAKYEGTNPVLKDI